MSRQDCSNTCQKRYKGIENFFRKIAFNLGNSPSQTEVKIISCIPIDVTDLQQKIADLERQLKEAEGRCAEGGQQTCADNASLVCPKSSKCQAVRSQSQVVKQINPHYFKPMTKVSQHYNVCPITSKSYSVNQSLDSTSDLVNTDMKQSLHNKKGTNSNNYCSRKLFSKKKKIKKPKPAIYYAHTEVHNPFNRHRMASPSKKQEPCLDQSYLGHIVRKQYMPTVAAHDTSITSGFSSPVCRDTAPVYRDAVPICKDTFPGCGKIACSAESDLCSCCHGPFHNIDLHLPTARGPPQHNYQGYYDSSLYDVIPVKEKPATVDVPKKKEHKKRLDIDIRPAHLQARHKMRHATVNYSTVTHHRENRSRFHHARKTSKEMVLKKMAAMKPLITCDPDIRKMSTESSKVCTVDISEVYARKRKKGPRHRLAKDGLVPKEQNNVSCSTKSNNTDCQTKSKIEAPLENKVASTSHQTGTETNCTPDEDKTVATLNQIKSILQSVLTEVKTNSSISNKNSNEQKTKDAVVQNGLSQSNMFEGSRILQSYTYSPYNIDPYMATCSRQLPTNQVYYNNLPPMSGKCVQNYPMYMQPSPPVCTACCSNNYSMSPPTIPAKAAASAFTNTDRRSSHTRETHKLIKEIYDSIAVNVDGASKTGKSQKPSENTFQDFESKKELTDNELNANGVSEIFKNSKTIETSTTPKTMFDSNDLTASFGTDFNNFKCGESRGERRTMVSEMAQAQAEELEEKASSEDTEDEETLTVSSDSESEEVEEDAEPQPPPKTKKNGIFSRVLKLFQPKTAKKDQDADEEDEDESRSESEDYESVYSHKTLSPRVLSPTIKFSRAPRDARLSKRSASVNAERRARGGAERRPYWDEHWAPRAAPPTPPAPYHRAYEARRVALAPPAPARRQSAHQAPAGAPPAAPLLPRLSWLKNQKVLKCGKQWKKLILEG